jgi:hypothetical protein
VTYVAAERPKTYVVITKRAHLTGTAKGPLLPVSRFSASCPRWDLVRSSLVANLVGEWFGGD